MIFFTYNSFEATFPHSFSILFFKAISVVLSHFGSRYQRPQRPRCPPIGPLGSLPRPRPGPVWPPLPPRPPLFGSPVWSPAGGSCPDSHSGVAAGLNAAAGAAFRAGCAGGSCGACITDSSLDLLLTGSSAPAPPSTISMSRRAATRVALDVRWIPSPAQMLVPSTVDVYRGVHSGQFVYTHVICSLLIESA